VCEAILGRDAGKSRVLNFTTAGCLLGMAMRGLA